MQSITDEVGVKTLDNGDVQYLHEIHERTWHVGMEMVKRFLNMGHIIFSAVLGL